MIQLQDLVERVARAIALFDGGKITGPSRCRAYDEFGWGPDGKHLEQYAEAHWQEHSISAEAVIPIVEEAMLGAKNPLGKSWSDWVHEPMRLVKDTNAKIIEPTEDGLALVAGILDPIVISYRAGVSLTDKEQARVLAARGTAHTILISLTRRIARQVEETNPSTY